jgi:Protein ChrB, N-terminal
VTAAQGGTPGEWVLLLYRLPREPSTPRIAVWRKLKRLGVAQVTDGLVALPAGARTREQLEWIAEEVTDSGGSAAIWLARPATRAQENQLAQAMSAARAAEYQALIATAATAAADGDPAARASAVRRLRNELRGIQRRDYFPPAERDQAQAAVQALAAPAAEATGPARPGRAGRPARQPAKQTARQAQEEPA